MKSDLINQGQPEVGKYTGKSWPTQPMLKAFDQLEKKTYLALGNFNWVVLVYFQRYPLVYKEKNKPLTFNFSRCRIDSICASLQCILLWTRIINILLTGRRHNIFSIESVQIDKDKWAVIDHLLFWWWPSKWIFEGGCPIIISICLPLFWEMKATEQFVPPVKLRKYKFQTYIKYTPDKALQINQRRMVYFFIK